MIFSSFRVESCSVCPVVRAGVERIDRVGSDGCTVSVTVLPKKNDILMSRGVSCIVLRGRRARLAPRQRAGEIYTLYSTLHRVPSPLGPSYARSTQVAHVPRCLPLFWDLPSVLFPPRALSPPSSCLGGLPLSDRLSEHSHP